MKNLKKKLILTLSVLGVSCVALASANAFDNATVVSANETTYKVYGASVRVADDKYGSGVKYHVVMSAEEFKTYGTIEDEKGTLNEGVSTYTLLMPYSLTDGDLTPDYVADNGAEVSVSDTSKYWTATEIDGVDYMESVIYLYNVPDTDYATAMSVRGYINNNGTPTYTEQKNGLSMLDVAKAELSASEKDGYVGLDQEDLDTLRETYVERTVDLHVNGEKTTKTVEYASVLTDLPTTPAVGERGTDNDYFLGWYTEEGECYDVAKPIKKNVALYAIYQESIVLKNANGDKASFDVANYQRSAEDTLVSMTLSLNGTDYALGNTATDLTGATDYATLATAYASHGEGEMTVVFKNAEEQEYTRKIRFTYNVLYTV